MAELADVRIYVGRAIGHDELEIEFTHKPPISVGKHFPCGHYPMMKATSAGRGF
jgi:hypothetical protein